MEEAKAAWEEVGSQFAALGSKLKVHFAHGEDDDTSEPSGAAAKDAMRDALRKLGTALEDAVEAVSDAAKDPAITDDVRKVGQSVLHAFQSTFADVSEDLRHVFSRARSSD
jgi:enamine deaminase RidA (YjgF/YER057c/UK114 family)